MALLEVAGVSGFEIHRLPDTAGADIPVRLFAHCLFAVGLRIVGAHDDVCLFTGRERIGDVKFKGQIAVLMFPDEVSVYPDFSVPIDCAEVEDNAISVPCFGHGDAFSVPADGVSGCVAVIAIAFQPAAGYRFGVKVGVFAEVSRVIGGFFFTPSSEALPGIRHLDVQRRVRELIGCEPFCLFADIVQIEGEVPCAVKVQPVNAFRGAALEIGTRVFPSRFLVHRFLCPSS